MLVFHIFWTHLKPSHILKRIPQGFGKAKSPHYYWPQKSNIVWLNICAFKSDRAALHFSRKGMGPSCHDYSARLYFITRLRKTP